MSSPDVIYLSSDDEGGTLSAAPTTSNMAQDTSAIIVKMEDSTETPEDPSVPVKEGEHEIPPTLLAGNRDLCRDVITLSSDEEGEILPVAPPTSNGNAVMEETSTITVKVEVFDHSSEGPNDAPEGNTDSAGQGADEIPPIIPASNIEGDNNGIDQDCGSESPGFSQGSTSSSSQQAKRTRWVNVAAYCTTCSAEIRQTATATQCDPGQRWCTLEEAQMMPTDLRPHMVILVPKNKKSGIHYYKKAAFNRLTKKNESIKYRLWNDGKACFVQNMDTASVACNECIYKHMRILMDENGRPVTTRVNMKTEVQSTTPMQPTTCRRQSHHSDLSSLLESLNAVEHPAPVGATSANVSHVHSDVASEDDQHNYSQMSGEQVITFGTNGLHAIQNDVGADAFLEGVALYGDPTALMQYNGEANSSQASSISDIRPVTPTNTRRVADHPIPAKTPRLTSTTEAAAPKSMRELFKDSKFAEPSNGAAVWYVEIDCDPEHEQHVVTVVDSISNDTTCVYLQILSDTTSPENHRHKLLIGCTNHVEQKDLKELIHPITTIRFDRVATCKKLQFYHAEFEAAASNNPDLLRVCMGVLSDPDSLVFDYMVRMISEHTWSLAQCSRYNGTVYSKQKAFLERTFNNRSIDAYERPDVKILLVRGPTRSGKTHWATKWATENYGSFYRRSFDQLDDFCRYKNEPVLIIDESNFNSKGRPLSTNQFLMVTESGVVIMNTKFGNVPLMSYVVIVITMRNLEETMRHDPEAWQAFNERIHWILDFKKKFVPPRVTEGAAMDDLRSKGLDDSPPGLFRNFADPVAQRQEEVAKRAEKIARRETVKRPFGL